MATSRNSGAFVTRVVALAAAADLTAASVAWINRAQWPVRQPPGGDPPMPVAVAQSLPAPLLVVWLMPGLVCRLHSLRSILQCRPWESDREAQKLRKVKSKKWETTGGRNCKESGKRVERDTGERELGRDWDQWHKKKRKGGREVGGEWMRHLSTTPNNLLLCTNVI